MSTAERDLWVSPAPEGQPRLDLPPPQDPPSGPPPQPSDHVPFDMDFIARALAAAIGEDSAPPALTPPPPQPVVPPLTDLPTPVRVSAPPKPPPPPPLPQVATPRVDQPVGRVEQPISRVEPATNILREDGRLFRTAPPKQSTGETSRLRGTRVALRTLLRQRRRMVLSIVAVTLGVGYLAGSLSLLQRVGAGLAEQAGAGSERADLVIEGTIAEDGPLQQVRKLVPDSLVGIVTSIDGVAAVEPRLESKTTVILRKDGRPVVGLGLTERPMGANFPTVPELSPYRFVGKGSAPTTESEVVLDHRAAEIADVAVGDSVTIAGKLGVRQFTVTGIVEMTHGELPDGSTLALFATDVARPLFELGPDDNAIAIKVADDVDVATVADRIRAVIGGGAVVSTGDEYAEHRHAALAKSFTLIRALLVGFAGLALVVGAFTVANSMSLLFDHRRRGFAMLRLMGASPRQLVSAAAGEALLGGAVAGALGLGLGVGVGTAIERLIHSMGTALPVAGPVLTWWIPVVSVLVGVAVTVLTALSPARLASRTPPVHAVTGADDRPSDRPLLVTALRWLAALVVVGGGTAAVAAILAGSQVALIGGLAGAGVVVVLIVLPRLLNRVVGLVTSLLLGSSVALRRMSALRSRQARTRAASTTAALLLAAAVVSSLTVLSTSFVQSFEGQISDSVTADLIVDSGTFTVGGLPGDLVGRLREIPGVEAVSGWRPGRVYVGNRLWRAGGLDAGSLYRVLNLDVVDGAPDHMAISEVAVSEELATEAGLRRGSEVPVTFQNGVVLPMKVSSVFRSDLRVLLGDVIVDSAVMASNLPQSVDVLAFVRIDPTDASAEATVRSTAAMHGDVKVLRPDELVAERTELLNGFGKVIQWMLAFSVVLALIGVANTLQLGVNERRRELGLIRAVGATRSQVLRLVVAEAGALSLVGTLFGIAIGTAAAWLTVQGLADLGLNQFAAPTVTLVVIAVLAIGLGLAGAVVPALSASRIPLLDAIAEANRDDARPARRRHHRRVDGEIGPSPTIVAPSSLRGAGSGSPPPNPEVHMALRCYNCGNEPGEGSSCVACGAPQALTPVGVFTLRPEATDVSATESWIGPETSTPSASSTVADTVPAGMQTAAGAIDESMVHDAIVVEDGHVVTGTTTGARQATPPPFAPTTTTAGNSTGAPTTAQPTSPTSVPPTPPTTETGTAPTPPTPPPYLATERPASAAPSSSIFESRPSPSEAHDPLRSPFGQHAAEPPAAPPDPAPVEHTPMQRRGTFSAGDAPTEPVEPTDQQRAPQSVTPPAFTRAVPPTPYAAEPAQRPTPQSQQASARSDSHGLAAAVARLSPDSQQHGLVPFSIAGALLGPDEKVLGTVAGSSLGMPTVVVVTESRALVVSDRRYVPDIEIFELGARLSVHGRHANEQASLTFADADRLITIDQIPDVGLAVELANTARTRTGSGEF